MENLHNPERQSPEINLVLQGLGEVALTYYNTEIFTFNKPFKHLNHVYYRGSDDQGVVVFDDQGLVKRLKHEGFPNHHYPWPDQGDETLYVEAQMATFGQGLDGLYKQGQDNE